MFLYYANEESDDVINSSLKSKILNQEYLQKYRVPKCDVIKNKFVKLWDLVSF